MKQFKPTWLYVKTHSETGLKYFGKTTSPDYTKYLGSGEYWLRHLSIHGSSHSTEIIGYFTDEATCRAAATKFSTDHDIVNSREWANLMIEDGSAGGDTLSGKTPEEKQRISAKRKATMSAKATEELHAIRAKISESCRLHIAENYQQRLESAQKIVESRKNNGNPWHSSETKEKIKNSNKSSSTEVREKLRLANLGKKNPEHSERMRKKKGVDSPNTRWFRLHDPTGTEHIIIGCKALGEFCKQQSLSYETLMKNLNKGTIQFAGARPRPKMRNCIGYKLVEEA